MAVLTHIADGLAPELRGNWKKFQCFCWNREYDLPDAENWTIVYTHHRDSDLLAESNAAAIEKRMEAYLESDDIMEESHNHWACGFVEGYAIRVHPLINGEIDESKYTPAFLEWCEIQEAIESYPVLDEEDYSGRELDACLKNIAFEGRNLIADEYSEEDWVTEVYRKLPYREIENRDGNGAYPSQEAIAEVLHELGWLDEDSRYLVEADDEE